VRRLAVAAAALVVLAACVHSETPAPAAPQPVRAVKDVVGIWRTIHQNTLQLRQDGSFLLVTSVANPLTGEYTLRPGRMDVSGTPGCESVVGSYEVQAAYQQRLTFRALTDSCELRRKELTVDQFVYANS
jgi:heat shock protein HslJ